ncbi:MAG: N-acylneuraminate cytidylyltransferase [Pseudohongiellaceae bacterium]|jgi:N-acylneuraminate cytidylyltransferase
MTAKKIAVIPARGSSKRIPKKNIRPFLGKPIVAYSIEAALASKCFDHVVVSTDDEAIAEVARDYGAQTPFMRPAQLSDDFAGTNAVAAHAIEWFQQQGHEVSHACCLYATAPFVTAELIQQGWQRLQETQADFAVTVTTFPFAIQRALRVNSDNTLALFYPEHRDTRSQDLEEGFHDVGQFYWAKAESFTLDKPLFDESECKTASIIVPRKCVQDIDTEEDWQEAELKYQVLHPEQG